MLGVAQAGGALARVLGPLIGNALLSRGTALPYLAGGIAMLAACLFAASSVRQPQPD